MEPEVIIDAQVEDEDLSLALMSYEVVIVHLASAPGAFELARPQLT